jgi:hypothetical protein
MTMALRSDGSADDALEPDDRVPDCGGAPTPKHLSLPCVN